LKQIVNLAIAEPAASLAENVGDASKLRSRKDGHLRHALTIRPKPAPPSLVQWVHVTLFSQTERSDPSPSRYGEDSFSFLDRVDQKFWRRIRMELEHWFVEYPAGDAADLRSRFRDKDPAQHFAAWWELYLHRLFSQLQFRVDIHPELAEVSGRPDFRITGPDGSFLVEAATTFSGIVDEDRDSTREGWIMAAIEEVKAPDFFVGISFEKVGMERPGVREIVTRVESWLAELDPDAITVSALEDAPKRCFDVRDWKFELTALPVKPESRGKPDHRVLGFGPVTAGYVNDVDMLERTLERKRRQYGKPDEPLVFAVLLMSPADNEDIEGALLGRIAWQIDADELDTESSWVRQRNGFWRKGAQARGTRVSAVITGTSLMPWNVATTWPRLWPNPWAARSLATDLPFPTAIADERGAVTYEDRDDSPAEIFGLPSDWPGPKDRFKRA
jgi:hypothetical protein